jgi:hypothetical protein
MKAGATCGWLILLLALATLGAGCASQRYVRETTQVAAGHIDSLQGDYARYLQRMERNAASRIDLLAQQRQRLARAERSLDVHVEQGDGLASYGPLYKELVAQAAEKIKTDRAVAEKAAVERAALLEKQKPLEKEPLKNLQEISKQLLELAEPTHLKGNAKFLFEYFQAVGKAVKDLDAKARSAKKDADKAEPKPAE